MAMPLLEGEIVERPDEDRGFSQMKRKIQILEQELSTVHQGLMDERKKVMAMKRSLGNLQKFLNPLFQSLKTIYGEFEEIDLGAEGEEPVTRTGSSKGVWDSWIKKLPGKQSEVIAALKEYGSMNVQQLRVATHSANQTVYDAISKLHKLGLINKSGGKYSLKEM